MSIHILWLMELSGSFTQEGASTLLNLSTTSGSSLLPLLISVALGHCLSICYEWTYEGLSYSRRFVNSLTLTSLSACALMLAMNAHLLIGLGLVGTLSMLRYRVNARDLWEMAFVFASLILGLAVGLGQRGLAASFCVCFCLTAVVLIKGSLGATQRFDGILRFWVTHENDEPRPAIEQVLNRHCSHFQLVSYRQGAQGEGAEVSYHIALKGRQGSDRRQASRDGLLSELRDEIMAEELTLLAQEHHVEL